MYNNTPNITPMATLIRVINPISFILNHPVMSYTFYLFDTNGYIISFYLYESVLDSLFTCFTILFISDGSLAEGRYQGGMMGEDIK